MKTYLENVSSPGTGSVARNLGFWSRLIIGATTVALTMSLATAGHCGKPDGVGGGPPDGVGGGPPGGLPDQVGGPNDPGGAGGGAGGGNPFDYPGQPADFKDQAGNNQEYFLYLLMQENEHMQNGLDNAANHIPPWAQNGNSPLWQAYEELQEQQLAHTAEGLDLNFDNDQDDANGKGKIKKAAALLMAAMHKADAANSIKNIPPFEEKTEVSTSESTKPAGS